MQFPCELWFCVQTCKRQKQKGDPDSWSKLLVWEKKKGTAVSNFLQSAAKTNSTSAVKWRELKCSSSGGELPGGQTLEQDLSVDSAEGSVWFGYFFLNNAAVFFFFENSWIVRWLWACTCSWVFLQAASRLQCWLRTYWLPLRWMRFCLSCENIQQASTVASGITPPLLLTSLVSNPPVPSIVGSEKDRLGLNLLQNIMVMEVQQNSI